MERISSPRNPAKMSSSALSTLLFVAICFSLSPVSGKSLDVTRMGSPAGAGYGLIVEPRDESMNELPRSRMFDESRNDDQDEKPDEDVKDTVKGSEERVPRDPPMIPGRVTTADVVRRLMLGTKVDDDEERRPYVDKRLVYDPTSLYGAEQQLLMKEILRELANVNVEVNNDANSNADNVYPNFFSSKPAHHHRTVQLLTDFNHRQHRYPLINNDFHWQKQQAPAAMPTTSLKRKTPDYYTEDYTGTGGGDIMMRQSRPRIQPLRWG